MSLDSDLIDIFRANFLKCDVLNSEFDSRHFNVWLIDALFTFFYCKIYARTQSVCQLAKYANRLSRISTKQIIWYGN